MKPCLVMGLLSCCIVSTLPSCLSPRLAASLSFQWPQVVGHYASQLTRDDIHQIVDLARSRPDIKTPVDQIDADRSDGARVKSGNPQKIGDPMSYFEIRKKNGRWKIIEKSVNTGPVTIMTG